MCKIVKYNQAIENYVPKYIDTDKLRTRCKQSIDSFENGMFGDVVNCPNGLTYTYLKRGGKILAVAHRDVVKSIAESDICRIQGNDFYAPQLDDRLGVHLILDVLAKYGIDYDILLTDGEEYGKSTAQYFTTDVDYNFIVEFDRAGLDTVMYEYHTKDKQKLLESYNLEVGWGSFTDICHLTHIGLWAVNFAVAYYGQHTLNCRVDMKQLEERLLPNIIKFLQENQNTKFVHEKDKVIQRIYGGVSGYSNQHYYNDYWDDIYTRGKYIYNNNKDSAEDTKDSSYKSDFSRQRWQRMIVVDGKYCCENCGRRYHECTGATCTFDKPKNTCKICTISGCVGYKKCPCCGFYYHRDKFMEHTGMCYECLRDVFEVQEEILTALYSISSNVVIQVADIINKIVDDKYDEINKS